MDAAPNDEAIDRSRQPDKSGCGDVFERYHRPKEKRGVSRDRADRGVPDRFVLLVFERVE